MKKNKMMRLASGLLVAVLLTTSMISGTYAKYVTTASADDTARVAKWQIKVNEKDITAGDAVTFDLFATVAELDSTTDDTDVKDSKIIAPGTQGKFAFDIENLSEVTANYAIKLTIENSANIPLQFSSDGTTWVDDIATIETDLTADLAIGAAKTTETVYWRWAFDDTTPGKPAAQSDAGDTALGVKGTDTVKVTAEITATQVN